MRAGIVSCLVAAALSGYAVAADVKVEWQEPEKFTDIRPTNDSRKVFRERVMQKFDVMFQEMAMKLPEGYQWQVKVTDIDLAGDVDYFAGGAGNPLRVVKDIYSPMIKFSYMLRDKHGEEVASAEEKLRDMGFMHSVNSFNSQGEFHYEQKMLESWFNKSLMPKVEQYAQALPKVSNPAP